MRDGYKIIRAGLSEAPPHDHDHLAYNALDHIERKLQEAERILKVLSRTGPIIPIQEAAAINEWLK